MSHACFVIWLVKFQKRSLKQSKRRTILAVRTGFGCWTSTPVWWMLSTAAKCIGNIHTQIVCRDYYKVIFSFFLQIFGGNVSNDQYYIMFEVSTARFFCFGRICSKRHQSHMWCTLKRLKNDYVTRCVLMLRCWWTRCDMHPPKILH